MKSMKEVTVVDVYLKGEMHPGFQKLAASTREKLESLKQYAGNNLVFRFSDPFEGKTEDEKIGILQSLAQKGVHGTNLQVKSDDGYSERIIIPYALVQYRGKEIPVNLLENNRPGMTSPEILNYSEALLEYKFATAINSLLRPDKAKIGYIMGNEENLGVNTRDALNTIRMLYHLDTIDLQGSSVIPGPGLGNYEAIIINNPRVPFDDKDKFKIDQFIMRGGHVLWILDGLQASMDSMGQSQSFLTNELPLNLDDMMFQYGVRVNADLVEDMDCNPIPVVVGMLGDKPQTELRPWVYFPVLMPASKHPIVHNMDPVMTMFASSIDTIANPDVRKTVLLHSSKYSRTTPHPARVSLSMMAYKLDNKMFNKPYQPVAVLLEGKFKSIFNNRLDAKFIQFLKDTMNITFQTESAEPTSMIVVADGDLIDNDYSEKEGTMEMGYWRFTRNQFANKTFFLNCLEYLTDRSGLLESRSKDVKLRLLDMGRVKNERKVWQFVNIVLPSLIILLFAMVYLFIRKRKYEKKP